MRICFRFSPDRLIKLISNDVHSYLFLLDPVPGAMLTNPSC